MPHTRRHRAERPDPRVRGRVLATRLRHPALTSVLETLAGSMVVLVGGFALGRAPAVTALAVTAPLATISTGTCGVILVRLSLRIHRRVHHSGPCRGAGYLGLGTTIAAATAVHLGALAVGLPHAVLAVQAGAVVVAGAYMTGLLLLPGATPDVGTRLRHGLDGTGIGTASFLVVWLLLLAPPGEDPPTGPSVLVGLLSCVALATIMVAGLRAVRHRRAALACAGGAALVIVGLTIPALGRYESPWLAVTAVTLSIGPVLLVVGARRADDSPTGWTTTGAAGGLAAQPLLTVPLATAIGVTAYHALTGGRFDAIAITVSLLTVTTVTARETFAALDVRRYAARLAAQQSRFRALVAGSADVTMVLDHDLVVRWQSPAAARKLGLSDQDVVDRPFLALVHADDLGVTAASLTAVLDGRADHADDAVAERPLRTRLRDGFGGWRDIDCTIRDLRSAPEVGALVVHVCDLGDRAGLRRQLDEATRTDSLTSLPNERRLRELAGIRLATGARGSVVMIGVYGIASVSHLYGTAVGDEILVQVARRLAGELDRGDVVARLPGEMFAVLTRCSALRAYPRAVRLVAAVTEPYELSGCTAWLTADAGIAELNGGSTADDAVGQAKLAVARARASGPGRVEGYDEELVSALRRRATIEQRLPSAVASGQFDLVYQPVLDLNNRRPIAVEALLRWRLPELGAVPPMEIVAAAEELGCVADLDTRVLRRACRQLATWLHDGLDLAMAVNVSPCQRSGDGLPLLVADALRRNDLAADRLIVEVAARDAPGDVSVAALAALREVGVRVALDHFGSDPLVLAQLPKLAIDLVKVGRPMFADPEHAMVDVVVSLGARLGFDVAAVGVETPAEVDLVRAAGCLTAQGFALSPPAHPEHVEAFLAEYRTRRV